MLSPISITALTLLLLSPVTLRYRYVPQRSFRYQVVEEAKGTLKVGDREVTPLFTRKKTLLLERRVLAVSGGKAEVLERPLKGHTTTETPAGISQEVIPPVSRVYTFTPQGKCLRVQRRVPAGVKEPRETMLEGLAFPFLEKPVNPGATWKGTVTTPGPNGKPLNVAYTSRYEGSVRQAGRICHKVLTTFSCRFRVVSEDATRSANGSLEGRVTAFLAHDLGQEVQSDAQLTLSIFSSAEREGKAVPIVRTTTIHIQQTLHP
jgi:hypothetical protein